MNIIIARVKNYGGITTFLFNFLDNIELSSEDVLLLDPSIDKNIINIIKKKNKINIIFFPEMKIKNIILNRLIQGIYILKLANKYNQLDKIIFIDWHLILDWVSHLKKYKFISFVHTYPTKRMPIFMGPFFNWQIRNTTIVTVSKFARNKISEGWHINLRDINILYNSSNFKGKNSPNDLKTDDVNVVTIAHCEFYKNPQLWYEVACEVVKLRENIIFHWYGDGSLFEYYLKLTNKNDRIIFHGYTKDAEIILSNNTTIYFQCSLVESLGISILDAMNLSVPAIVSDVGGMPELVKNAKNGYVCQTKEDFISKIIILSGNPALHKSMSRESKIRYEKYFSKKMWIKQLKNLLFLGKT